MRYPPYVTYAKPSDYKRHFQLKYCGSSIRTFDGIEVKFYPEQFKHAFYASPRNKPASKSLFDAERAKRIDWIEIALKDKQAHLRQGFDNLTKLPRPDRRVCLVKRSYVVVIQLKDRTQAVFITAFVASKRAKKLILAGPMW